MPARADLQGTSPKPKTSENLFNSGLLGLPSSQGKRGQEQQSLHTRGTREHTRQIFPGERKTCFRSAAPQKIVTDHTCLFKKQYFLKDWDLQFWSFLPCNSYSRMTQVPINNQTTVQQPGSLSNYEDNGALLLLCLLS